MSSFFYDELPDGKSFLCIQHGGAPTALARIIRAGYDFDHPDEGTQAVRALVHSQGLSHAVETVSGLDRESVLYQMIFNV